MQRWKPVLFNLAFALNCLLLFFLLFENKLHVPAWLQVAGRMHTLFLHFPIVMVSLCVFWELFAGYKKAYTTVKAEIGDDLLLLSSLTAVITALMGLFLSREDGYTPDLLVWHKWGGIFISFLTLLWYTFRVKVREIKVVLLSTALAGIIVIIVTGHLGANITHGQDFLLAPVLIEKQKPMVLLEDAMVFDDMVQPILQAKCMSCHNNDKGKGGLLMETKELLMKGGKHGALWDPSEEDFGLLLRRIHLPLENKKHMPPEGKPQLTDEEASILYQWVKQGATFIAKVASLSQNDTLRMLAEPLFQTVETDDYTFAPADEKKVNELNNNYRIVHPLAVGSPALGATFFSREQFQGAQLKELAAVKGQLVSLNLDKMPVTNNDLETIGQFTVLRKLNLSFTNVTGAGLKYLLNLKELKSLSLSGTKVGAESLAALHSLPKLTQLFLWNTGIDSTGIETVKKTLKNVTIETGFNADTMKIRLNPPEFENEAVILTQPEPLQLKHYVKNVTLRYTIDNTEPDSISPVYKTDSSVMIGKGEVIKVKAFKNGWLPSEVVKQTFYRSGILPDSVHLLNAPDSGYMGQGGSTLYDLKKGSLNFGDGKWLGFRKRAFEALFYLNGKKQVSLVTISSQTNIGPYLMPPKEIQVWGGEQPSSLHLLKRMVPVQPTKEEPSLLTSYDASFSPGDFKLIKVVIIPLPQLPAWHKAKKEKGWFFVDEILLN